MPRFRKARTLRRGERVAFVLPSGPLDEEHLERGEVLWRGLGFEPVRRADATAQHGYLAGDDTRRAGELLEFAGDPRIGAIVCARGGYGAHRIVDRLDPAVFRAAARPLVGYSDATTLLLWLRRAAGLSAFHGPMLERGDAIDPDAVAALADALCGGVPEPWQGRPLAPGCASGRLTGGSLNLVTGSLGTPWEIDTRGAILLLEDTNEPPYKVDRMLQQLRAAGKLAACAAIGLGAMVNCEDARYPTHGVDEVIREIVGALGIPVLGELPFGHVDSNWPWPYGVRAELDADAGVLRFLEAGVTERP